jgi:hypothetical protein
MRLFEKHWYDVGAVLALCLFSYLALQGDALSEIKELGLLNLGILLIHQFEEYRYPGYFPGLFNTLMYRSGQPDRYPLNARAAYLINMIAWVIYIAAFLLAGELKWLDVAVMFISFGNLLGHVMFSVKARALYNPGLFTAVLSLYPVWGFVGFLAGTDTYGLLDIAAGIAAGIAISYFGIFRMINWTADVNSLYRFEERQVRPAGEVHNRD